MATKDTSETEANVPAVSSVPLLDIQSENEPLNEQMCQAISEVVKSGRFVFGPDCQQLEAEIAELCGVDHAVGCASGSDALLLSLMALGISAGDEVIVPSFTFFASVSAPWRLGAKVVFADIDPVTFNLDPAAVTEAVTPQTKAIIPVHLFGQCCEMDAISEIASHHNLAVVEDAAQAIGAKYHHQAAGGIGQTGCFSFYPTKNLGGCGDAGMITTNDSQLAEQMRQLRNHGMEPRYYHSHVGINSRLDSIQAAALRVKLPHLEQWTNSRRKNASRYDSLFRQSNFIGQIKLPAETAGRHHVWNQYTIRVPMEIRDSLRNHLREANIGSEIYYPVPMHRQACFQNIEWKAEKLTETDKAAQEVLSLPIFPQMCESQQAYVVEQIGGFFAGEARTAA